MKAEQGIERNILSDSPLKLGLNYLGRLPENGMTQYAGLDQEK